MTTGAALLYLMLGNPAGMDPAQVAGNDSHQITPQQVEQMVETLAKKLESEPDNLEGWVMLGRSYRFLGRFDEAAAVYERLAARTPRTRRSMPTGPMRWARHKARRSSASPNSSSKRRSPSTPPTSRPSPSAARLTSKRKSSRRPRKPGSASFR